MASRLLLLLPLQLPPLLLLLLLLLPLLLLLLLPQLLANPARCSNTGGNGSICAGSVSAAQQFSEQRRTGWLVLPAVPLCT